MILLTQGTAHHAVSYLEDASTSLISATMYESRFEQGVTQKVEICTPCKRMDLQKATEVQAENVKHSDRARGSVL